MLSYKNVDVSINRTPILRNVSVDFEKGKLTTIVGPNGCGKTTLIQAINGLSNVTAGKISIEDRSIFELSDRERAKIVSFMAQFRDGIPAITVGALVEHGRFPYMGFSRRMSPKDREAVDKALEYTRLIDYRDTLVSELSGGQQQRAFLAMQLAQNSPYMILDEPMNHMDFPARREMHGLLKELVGRGKTIILVSHDLGEALKLSDCLVVMQDRAIVGVGSPKECLENGFIEKVFNCQIKKIELEDEAHFIFL